MPIRTVSSLLLGAALFLAVACNAGNRDRPTVARKLPEPTPNPTITPQPRITTDEFLKSEFYPMDKWERDGLLRAWHKVPAHKNYEMVQDVYGEIAGAYGLALIIADKSLSADSQFSLIVFIRRPGNKYDLYWIYHNENLSRISLSRSSGDIFVSGLREDGSNLNCEIAWSRKDNKWTCIGL
jgi:hypothetical protein